MIKIEEIICGVGGIIFHIVFFVMAINFLFIEEGTLENLLVGFLSFLLTVSSLQIARPFLGFVFEKPKRGRSE